ncbi:MAG TPA: hypothetical protein VGN24_10260 [Rhodanobacter sp.]|jgi:hypothetical protein|nr:hypothetical protein [Rhodanobacter sp.]
MRYLSLLLLAPWLLVLCWIYWAYPRDLPAGAGRRSFDVLALLLTGTATALAALAGFDTATLPQVEDLGRPSGSIWQQVLPALYGYGAFTVVLLPALWLRQRCWGRRTLADAGK